MNAYTPKLTNLSHLRMFIPQFPLSNVWEIPGCDRDQDIMWNIIMAYMNHSPLNDSELMKRIRCLQDDAHLEVRDLKNCIKNYNPFLHRNTDACNRIMNDIVQPFKTKTDVCYAYNRNLFLLSYENYIFLQASALLLKCNIVVLIKEFDDRAHINVFPEIFPINPSNKWLVIFDQISNNTESFSFGMIEEIGLNKQMLALKEILKKTKITENDCSSNSRHSIIYQICGLPKIRQNFVSSIIRSKFSKIIAYIYNSPYVIAKLRDALFETDPLAKDEEEKSALYYALTCEDTSLLYFLYDQTTKICIHTGGSISCSTRAVLENLFKLRNYFEQMTHEVNDESENLRTFSMKLRSISRFNEYQIEICQILNNLVLLEERNGDSLSSMFEAEERRKAILCILETYDRYFNVTDLGNNENSKAFYFLEFCKQNDYITNIDFMTTLRFFDHLFLLKERLALPSSMYTELENKFFSYTFCKDCMKQLQKYENPASKMVSRMILYEKRLSLRNHVEIFRRKLKNQEICSENVVKNIPENLVQTLTNLPDIYGQFLVHRLKYYLVVATSVTVTDVKSILILERALLVIGECLKQTDIGFKTIQKILPLILPSQLVSTLKRIRNSLSHFPQSQVLWRNSVEEEIQLFKNIQLELKTLTKILMPIFSAQKFRMERFILLMILNDIRKTMSKNALIHCSESLKDTLPPFYLDSDIENLYSFQKKWKEHFKIVKKSLSAKMLSLNAECIKLDERNACFYDYSVMNLFDSVGKAILKCNESNEIDDYVWALEYILEYISFDSKAKEYKRKILAKLKHRKNLFQKYRKQENLRQKLNDSIQNVIPNESTLVRKDFSKLYNTKPFTENSNSIISEEEEKKLKNQDSSGISRRIENTEDKSFNEHASSARLKFESCKCEEKIEISFESLKNKTSEIISDYQKIYREIITNTNLKVTIQSDTRFKNIGILKKALAGHSFLNNKEKKKIIDSIPAAVKDIPDHFEELKELMEKGEITNKNFEILSKKLEIPLPEQNILKKIVIGQKPKEPGNGLMFLRNRVQLLKEILIDSDKDIKQLSEKAKSPKTKSYLLERIVQLYLKNPEVQASVEMLLFDCMNLLKRRDLQDLWRKSSNLFNGINLRNVLAHGNPLLESVGRILDPYDLPTELIRKMLQLVNDLRTIDSMVNMIENSNADFKDFHNIMNDEECNKYDDFKKIILDCDRWKDYAFLIPVKKSVADSCN